MAAFLVLTGHARHLILVDFEEVQLKSLPLKAMYLITGLGHEAVIIFFVISGFLVGGLTLERWRKHNPNLAAYTSARVSRIYTVLIPALLAGVALDLIGLRWFNASELYTNSEQYRTISLNYSINAAMNLPTLLGNLFMLQGILTANLGSNSPLWSLAYEWWYYCIFALVGAALTEGSQLRIGYIVAAITLAVLLPSKLVLWGTIWLLGIVAHVWIRSTAWRPRPSIGIVLFLTALLISRLTHNLENVTNNESLFAEFIRDFGLAIGYVVALVSVSRLTMSVPLGKVHERLADFSYTTYLCHFPAMLFIVAAGYQVFGLRFQIQPMAFGVIYLGAMILMLYLYCYVFSLITERHTPLVRKKLDTVMGADQNSTKSKRTPVS